MWTIHEVPWYNVKSEGESNVQGGNDRQGTQKASRGRESRQEESAAA
jgi:hypothetical protein